jgi:hypothetical protein
VSTAARFATTADEFAELTRRVSGPIDISQRLPAWPFRAPTGFATIYEYDIVLGGDFGLALEALAGTHGDDVVYVVGVEPEMTYYRDEYGMLPAFEVNAAELADGYFAGITHEPGGDGTGALNFSLDAVAMTGSSGAWAVWAQRDWEIGLLLTPEPEGPWLATEPWFDREIDLAEIRAPAGWCMPLTDDDLTTFRQNVRTRGSGPSSSR